MDPIESKSSKSSAESEKSLAEDQAAFLRERKMRLTAKRTFASEKLSKISEALKANMPEQYRENAKKLMLGNNNRPGIPRHGNRKFERGGSTLKIDMAGSGYESSLLEHKGMNGCGEMKDENGKLVAIKKLKLSWYNVVFGPWIKFIRSPKQIEQENEKRAVLKAKFKDQFGDKVSYGKNKMKHVHKRVIGNTTKVSMAGPLAINGVMNAGTYSIENLRKYILESGKEYIQTQIKNSNGVENIKDKINIDLRGHSRGGVASLEGGMMLKHWISETHPSLLSKVKFSLLQNDPVPGMGSMAAHEAYDHRAKDVITTKDGQKMMPLGANADTTVIYSMHAEYKVGFTPQTINGAKRVILSPLGHKVGIDDVNEKDKQREGFVYNGEAYGHRSLSALPEGVYMMDEENNLMRLNGSIQAKKVLDETMPDTLFQKDRHQVLKNVVKDWFEKNPNLDNDIAKPEVANSKQSGGIGV